MSSFNINSDVSGDEVQNFTMQWNYAAAAGRKPRKRRMREPFEIPRFVKLFGNVVCMLAGAATTVAAIGFATGLLRIESFLQ